MGYGSFPLIFPGSLEMWEAAKWHRMWTVPDLLLPRVWGVTGRGKGHAVEGTDRATTGRLPETVVTCGDKQ